MKKFVRAKNKVYLKMRECAAKLLSERERGETNVIVMLLMIVVALGLCIIFRDEITSIIDTLFNTHIDSFLGDL